MCESFEESALIRVSEKTIEGKYEFLKSYYQRWNQITNPAPRIIIDTHAGSGIVEIEKQQNLFKKKVIDKIFGSPILAIIKTLTISSNLLIILNEPNEDRITELENVIEDFKQFGVPFFQIKNKIFRFKSLESKRKKELRLTKKMKKFREKKEKIFPDSPNEEPPLGYFKDRMQTKAEIIILNKKIEDIINNIIEKYINKKYIKKDKELLPKVLFLVDPCGKVGWNEVVVKICRRSNKREGTELILNWSWDVINRNPHNKKKILSDIYGIPIKNIEKEFKGITKMEHYLEKYKNQLKKYFKYVGVPVKVQKGLKLQPKQKATYVLLYCTNNKSGRSLAGYKEKRIKSSMRKKIGDLKDWIYNT